MKKKLLFLLAITLVAATSCQKRFDELETDPNRPVTVPASLALNGIEVSINQRPWGIEHRWNQYACCNYNYYGNQEYNWTGATLYYLTLKNVIKMEEEAVRGGAVVGRRRRLSRTTDDGLERPAERRHAQPGVVRERGVQDLHRNAAAEADVVGHVHPTAGARSDRTEQAVAPGEHASDEVGDGARDEHFACFGERPWGFIDYANDRIATYNLDNEVRNWVVVSEDTVDYSEVAATATEGPQRVALGEALALIADVQIPVLGIGP